MAVRIANLEAQVAAQAEEHRRLVEAIRAWHERLNGEGALQIADATLDNTPIGATTKAAGSFSSLNVSVGGSSVGTMEATTGSGAIQVGKRSTIQSVVNGTYLAVTINARYDGALWKYIETAPMAQYYLDPTGAHVWVYAPSGTAGTTATLTELMRLTSTGLGIGMTPARALDVTGTFGATGAATLGSTLAVTGAVSPGNTINAVSPTAPNRTVTMVVGGVTLYLHAKTTND